MKTINKTMSLVVKTSGMDSASQLYPTNDPNGGRVYLAGPRQRIMSYDFDAIAKAIERVLIPIPYDTSGERRDAVWATVTAYGWRSERCSRCDRTHAYLELENGMVVELCPSMEVFIWRVP